MTKQTVYLNNFARKSDLDGISEAVCLLNSPLLERSDYLSNYIFEKGFGFITSLR